MSLLRRSSEVAIDPPHDASAKAKPRKAATETEHERDVIEAALRRAFKIASESDPSVRAVYWRLHRNTLIPLLEIDPTHRRSARTVPVSDIPFLAENLKTCEPRMVVLDALGLGPQAREITSRVGVVAAVIIPVIQESATHGVMVIGTKRPEISEEVFQALVSVKGLLELALSKRSLP